MGTGEQSAVGKRPEDTDSPPPGSSPDHPRVVERQSPKEGGPEKGKGKTH